MSSRFQIKSLSVRIPAMLCQQHELASRTCVAPAYPVAETSTATLASPDLTVHRPLLITLIKADLTLNLRVTSEGRSRKYNR